MPGLKQAVGAGGSKQRAPGWAVSVGFHRRELLELCGSTGSAQCLVGNALADLCACLAPFLLVLIPQGAHWAALLVVVPLPRRLAHPQLQQVLPAASPLRQQLPAVLRGRAKLAARRMGTLRRATWLARRRALVPRRPSPR